MFRLILFCLSISLCAQPVKRLAPAPYETPVLAAPGAQGLEPWIGLYQADRGALLRFYNLPESPATHRRMAEFYRAWQKRLNQVSPDSLSPEGKVDHVLFANLLDRELAKIEEARRRFAEIQPLVPFAATVIELREARQRVDPIDAPATASRIVQLQKQIAELSDWLNKSKPESLTVKKTVARRAAQAILEMREGMKNWFQFYAGYDPDFTWWVTEPYHKLDESLGKYASVVREKGAGLKADDKDTILGDPIGREALLQELRFEFIPYTPEELIERAEKEFAWCETEMRRASRDLGFGDDWKKALEHVKNLHVAPGAQPALILQLAQEAQEFLQQRDLITIPPLASEIWRMNMMTPERQRVNPFFTGGEVITVSFPTSEMSHEQKLMSLRGNNIHFSRATVHHELIPGHHLQMFMNRRHHSYRQAFMTPFWMEGWALYWELLLWDLQFPKTAEDRVGMLFWRMHRCARIIFSLNFHLEKMTAQQCVDFLVDRVGHERENAAGEVRRSFETSYEPLYQAAYLLGGMQFRSLHGELVESRKMTNRQFHDAILQLGPMPVALTRAALRGEIVAQPNWRF